MFGFSMCPSAWLRSLGSVESSCDAGTKTTGPSRIHDTSTYKHAPVLSLEVLYAWITKSIGVKKAHKNKNKITILLCISIVVHCAVTVQ